MKGIEPIYTEKVLQFLHKKYLEGIKLYDLTAQMNDSLNHNDIVSTQLFLTMRKDVILAVAIIDEEISMLVDSMPEEWQRRMKQLISPSWKDLHITVAAETKVGEEWEKVRRQMEKTIELDKLFSLKVGGKDSFYSEK